MEGTPADPRALLKKYGLGAKKSWGQNFLISEAVYRAIVQAAVDRPDAGILEIGAGLGTLTARLAAAVPAGHVIAIERERDMVEVLQQEYGAVANLEIREANALTLHYPTLARDLGGPLVVVGNLPYQIASPLIFNLIEARAHVRHAVVMLQKEMAQRLAATPGTRASSALTVLIQAYADVEVVVNARAGCFHPPPRVDSQVVRIIPLAEARVPAGLEDTYRKVVNAAFGQRRKTLRNALGTLPGGPEALGRAGIDPMRRGETLSIAELASVAAAVE